MITPVGEQLANPRFTDSELVQLRLDAVNSEVIMPLIDRADFNYMQKQTVLNLSQELCPDHTVDMPTRSGKSYLIRQMAIEAADKGFRTAILAHRRHIIGEHEHSIAENSPHQPTSLFTETADPLEPITIDSVQGLIAKVKTGDVEVMRRAEQVDVVFIDEAHRALGEKTVDSIRAAFPNAIRIVFTATPDYAEDRSVTDEYGEKVVSYPPVEAIRGGIASPVNLFVYKTEGQIDKLDPNFRDFTPRELERLANLAARNQAIVDFATDLIQDGRQGIISTIPGESLVHADVLKKRLNRVIVTNPDGSQRHIRSEVVKGDQPGEAKRILAEFEDGEVDVLLFCDLISEGWSSKAASFFINGCPTTSIVKLTQQLGRVLQLKDQEAVAIDFVDSSIGKKQRTLLEVLEYDRAVQGLRIGSTESTPSTGEGRGDTYLRGIFRPELMKILAQIDNKKIVEILYNREELEALSPYERLKRREASERAREEKRLVRHWDKILRKEGLPQEPKPDYFNAPKAALKSLAAEAGDLELTDISLTDGLGNPLQLYEPARNPRSSDDELIRGVNGHARIMGLILPTITAEPVVKSWTNSAPVEQTDVHHQIENAELRNALDEVMKDELTLKQRTVIGLRFGLDGEPPKTLEEVGTTIGLTREAVRQIEAKTLAALRHPNRTHSLLTYSDYRPRWLSASPPTYAVLSGISEYRDTEAKRSERTTKRLEQTREEMRRENHRAIFTAENGARIKSLTDTITRRINELVPTLPIDAVRSDETPLSDTVYNEVLGRLVKHHYKRYKKDYDDYVPSYEPSPSFYFFKPEQSLAEAMREMHIQAIVDLLPNRDNERMQKAFERVAANAAGFLSKYIRIVDPRYQDPRYVASKIADIMLPED